MVAMIRAVARLCIVVTALAAFLPIAPTYAQVNFAYVSATGSGTSCTATQPCPNIAVAIGAIAPPLQIICLDGDTADNGSPVIVQSVSIDIDCPLGTFAQLDVQPSATNATLRLRHLRFPSFGFGNYVRFFGGGTLIFEDCVFADATAVAFDIEPSATLNLVIRNSRISNSGSGMLLKPAAGGSIKATLDHVTVTDNGGGGIKTDSTNGVVNLDISDSEISNNVGNGINLVGSANQNMLNLSRVVIAKNGVAGLQANGATAAALVDTTLFDTNTSGATSVVGGGRVLTYGNNRIVGTAGSGFTGSASLQ
jgi:hypothetical protein